MDPRLARLTEGQRTCLRMVLAHKSSKDIARTLGISRHTVDQRLKLAMKCLGAAGRVEAAQIHAQLEGAYQPLAYQSPDIADLAGFEMLGPSAGGSRQAASVGAMREERAAFTVDLPERRPARLPLPLGGGAPNDLTAWQRLGWILAIVVLTALVFGIFVTGLEALSRLVRASV